MHPMSDAPLRAPLRIKPAFAMGDNATVARSERELVEQILRAMDASPTSEVLITPVSCLSSETNKSRCLSDVRENAREAANEIVEAFSRAHPSILMNMNQWLDLKEIIEREFCGESSV